MTDSSAFFLLDERIRRLIWAEGWTELRDAQEKVAKIVAQAKECLEKQKNYTCAIAKAEAALDLIPNNVEALAIKTRSQETQRKIKETGFNIK